MKAKSKIILICSLGSLMILSAGSLAFFTDFETGTISAFSGRIDVDVSHFNLTNRNNITPGDNDPIASRTYTPVEGDPLFIKSEAGTKKESPTTDHKLTYNIENKGNIAIKTRHTILISCKKNGAYLDPSVFRLYNGSKELETKSFLDEEGNEINSGQPAYVKYTFIADNLNGDDETQTIAKGKEMAYSYDFSMEKEASTNIYQDGDITVSVIVEAMQYKYTNDSDWEVVFDRTIQTFFNGEDVPK